MHWFTQPGFGRVFVCLLCACWLSLAQANSYDDFHRALLVDNPRVLRSLVARGFDPNSPDPKGNPAIVAALLNDSLGVFEYLVSLPEVDVEARNPSAETALMIAAIRGHVSAVEALLARRAQVNQPGWTALHYAASHPEKAGARIAQLLLEQHAYIDAQSPNLTTPLMMAARYGHEDTVRLLLAEGADVSYRNAAGLNAMDFARLIDRDHIVELVARHVRDQKPKGQW